MYYEECTIEEVLAYRELEEEYFDFGEGPMKPSSSNISEDDYYEMRIQWEEDMIENNNYLNHMKVSSTHEGSST